MSRMLVLALALALLAPTALAFDLEKWADGLAKKQMEGWKRESMQTIAKDPDPEKRRKAVQGLPVTDPDSLAAFAAALSDRDARVRQAAASQLWQADKRAEPYRPQLTRALDDPDANVVAQAAGALQATGVKEAELAAARKRVLDAPEALPNARFLAARNLVGYEAPGKLVGPMLAYLEQQTAQGYSASVADRNRHNVELAERALVRLVKNTKDRALVQPMWIALVETKHAQIPLMKALGTFEPRPEGWTGSLVRQLDNANPSVRHEALNQLRSVKGEKEVAEWAPRAAAMLKDPDSSVRSNALWALGSAKGLAAGEIDKVVAATGDADAGVRRAAVRALGEIAEANQAIPAATRARIAEATRPALDKALLDDDKEVREAAKHASRQAGSLIGTAVAAASPAAAPAPAAPAASPVGTKAAGAGGNEAAAMAFLRARNVKFDESSWFTALRRLDVPLVHAFLDAGMSPNAGISELGPPIRVMLFASPGCSPAVRPTKAEAKAIVKLLLERGADVRAADGNGNTAITEAAVKGCDRELMRTLIQAGAKIDATNASGLTPFEMGLWSGHDGLEELIAAGYRLPPEKAKIYIEAYKDRPAAQAMARKASGRK